MTVKISKVILWLLAQAIFLVFSPMVKEKTVNSYWISSTLNIDGSQTDWLDIPKISVERLKIDYSFMNDDNNLFILLIFNDSKFLSSIRATGLKIWLNADGEKSEECGIKFKERQITSEQLITKIEKNRGILPKEQKAKIRQKSNYISCEGDFIDKKEKVIDVTPLNDQFKPAVFRTGRDQKLFCYELRIPLKIKEIWKGQEPDFERVLTVGFEWGGMTKEMKAEMMKRRAENASRVSERATEFRVDVDESDHAPVVGDRNLPFQKGDRKHLIWVDVKLAKNQ